MSQPAAATLASVDPPPPIVYAPPAGVPQILFMDEVLLVIDKPAGLLSVPGRGPDHADSLASRIQAEYPDARIVHRLDLATSGLLVMARGHEMERRLSIAFQQRQVDKYYVAVVAGHPQPERSQINLPLIADWPNRPRQKVDRETGKPSLTTYTVIEHDDTTLTSRVELQPLTGRTHQLRVHLMAIGHPILGDDLYADPASRAAAPRLLLHATRLDLPHPGNGRRMTFSSPAPF
ncbi:pseudouridine synthase [Zoogloea sp.]|jgi:tRNA pseudouridine32 synthase/23S rRNA pseudouridine746 synthase|uniref:pseudouridine synthase n=1 Tax=Zoogloea sp. TaxID=49181 RepID=UPI0037DA5A38